MQAATATIGFFLTLIGLLGTFFYVHLSAWYADILQLQAKWDLNRIGQEERRVEGRLECRYELARLKNWVPFVISLLISVFMVYLGWTVLKISQEVSGQSQVLEYYYNALIIFAFIYFGLTLFFLIRGYHRAFKLSRAVMAKTE